MKSFYDQVYDVVEKIPYGHVATFGQIALAVADLPFRATPLKNTQGIYQEWSVYFSQQ